MKFHLRNKRILITSLVACIAVLPVMLYWLWNPGPTSMIAFDKKTNGIWVGHQWFTGKM